MTSHGAAPPGANRCQRSPGRTGEAKSQRHANPELLDQALRSPGEGVKKTAPVRPVTYGIRMDHMGGEENVHQPGAIKMEVYIAGKVNISKCR